MSENPPIELNRAVPGGRVEIFAVQDEDYPGGWFYRFQYYHPDKGELLRYDNAHKDKEIGWHHRHIAGDEDTAMTFHTIVSHLALFFREIAYLTETENND